MHIIDVNEELVMNSQITILKEDEFAYLLNPMNEKGINQLGKKILLEGPKSFFLQPGEEIPEGI